MTRQETEGNDYKMLYGFVVNNANGIDNTHKPISNLVLNEIVCASGATFDWVMSNINCTASFYLHKTCLMTSSHLAIFDW